MGGIFRFYILQKIEDISLSLKDIFVGEVDLELLVVSWYFEKLVCKEQQRKLEKFIYVVDLWFLLREKGNNVLKGDIFGYYNDQKCVIGIQCL